ncbi:MAG TPA: hypothetical protein VEK15_03360 [Vicinamibacteria bacterium]|nr:hypothetical protein [Vicinamibacteria bacterium]
MDGRVTYKVDSIWSTADARRRALEILRRYAGDGSESGQTRIRLAMLKLAAGSLDKLEELLEDAQRDFRDVVAAAEYPEALRSKHLRGPHLSPEEQREREAIRQRDRRQYERWLNE